MTGPLNGIRVLEFGQIIAAPLGCQLLADLGAEVIKIEALTGDPWRFNASFMPNESKWFHTLNRGKQSVAIDLAHPEAREAVHRLAKTVDVVVVNFRPDVTAKLGIDYETLAALRPGLIYVDNTAFGRKGPLAERPGYDIVVQAFSGLLSGVGKTNDEGVPVVSPAFADAATGYAIATGVCAALFHRATTGQGQKVETSLLINALTLHMNQFPELPAADAAQRAEFAAFLADAEASGHLDYATIQARRNALFGMNAGTNLYYRCYYAKDGVIAIGALSSPLREKVRQVLGVEHNRDVPGYDPGDPAQKEIDAALTRRIEAMIRAETCDHWETVFRAGGVPVSRLNFTPEMIDNPQVLANDYVIELEHDLSGPERMAAPPWQMSGTPLKPETASPPLGRDTASVLSSLGYDAATIASMRERGVIL
jgi:formyl-CoA transferase